MLETLARENQQERQDVVARIAALIDGDGSITLSSANAGSTLAPQVCFFNTDETLIENFCELVAAIGSYANVYPKKRTLGRRAKFAAMVIGFDPVQILLEQILDHLNDKKQQAGWILDFIKVRKSKSHQAPYNSLEFEFARMVRSQNDCGGNSSSVRKLSKSERLSRLVALFDTEGTAILYILKPKPSVNRTTVRMRRRLAFTSTFIALHDEIIQCLTDLGIGFRVQSHQPINRRKRFQIEICGTAEILRLLTIILGRMKGEKKRESVLLFHSFVLRRSKLRTRKFDDEDIRVYNLFRQANKYLGAKFSPESSTTIRRARIA